MTTAMASTSTPSSASSSPTSLTLASVPTTRAPRHDPSKVHPKTDKSVSTPSSRSPSRTPSQQRQPTPESPRKCTACTQRRPHHHHNHSNTPDSQQQQQHISFGRPTRPLQGRASMDQDEPFRRPRGNSSSTAGSRSSSTASSSSSSSNSLSSSSRAPLDRKRPLTTTTTHTASVTVPPATERPRWVGAWSTSSPTSTSTSSPSTCKIASAPCPSTSTHTGQQQQHQRRQSFSSRSSMTDHGVDTSKRASRHARNPLEEPVAAAPFSPCALRARVTASASSSSSSLSTTARRASTTTATIIGATATAAATGARDELDQDQGKKKMNPTKFARGRSASIAACAKQPQQSLPLQEQQLQQQQLQQLQQQQRHGRPMHEPRQHSRHLSIDIKAKDKPMRRGTVGDQQQQQQQKVRRTAQTEKNSSLVSQGQQQQQQKGQCMQQDASVQGCQENPSSTTPVNSSQDSSPQRTEDEACQEKAAPVPLVQVTISTTPADDPTPPLCSLSPVETSPALIRRFLVKDVTAAASTPSAVAIAQPSMPRTTVALSSFENAALTQECTSTAAAWSPSTDRGIVSTSSAQQQDDSSATTLSIAVPEPVSMSSTTRPLAAPSSSPQLSAAQIMVSRIVEKNKRRRSLGDLMNIMSKKTRGQVPQPRASGSGTGALQQDTMAADAKSAGRRSVSETPCGPTHVSTLESFPKHSSTSSLRIQYLKDFFRSGPSTAAHARSASVADVLIGRENGRSDHGNTAEERRRDHVTTVIDTTCQAPPNTPTTEGPCRISESASSSRRSSFMALLPGLSRNPPRLWVTTAAGSSQDANPGTPRSRSTRQHSSEEGSQFSSSSRTHSNSSSACPSPVLDRIHAVQQGSTSADYDAPGFRDQMLPRPVHCLSRRAQDCDGRSERPSPLPSLTSVNAIWKNQLVQGNFMQDESYPSQEPNNSNSDGDNSSSSGSNGKGRGSSANGDDDGNDQRASSAGTLESTGRWPWAQLDKDKWNTTFLSAHRGLLLLPPTYSPADEMGDPLATYHPNGRPQSILGAGGSSLEDGNCLHLRFGGTATSLESTSLAGSRMSGSVYFEDTLGQTSYGNGLYGSQINSQQQQAGFV